MEVRAANQAESPEHRKANELINSREGWESLFGDMKGIGVYLAAVVTSKKLHYDFSKMVDWLLEKRDKIDYRKERRNMNKPNVTNFVKKLKERIIEVMSLLQPKNFAAFNKLCQCYGKLAVLTTGAWWEDPISELFILLRTKADKAKWANALFQAITCVLEEISNSSTLKIISGSVKTKICIRNKLEERKPDIIVLASDLVQTSGSGEADQNDGSPTWRREASIQKCLIFLERAVYYNIVSFENDIIFGRNEKIILKLLDLSTNPRSLHVQASIEVFGAGTIEMYKHLVREREAREPLDGRQKVKIKCRSQPKKPRGRKILGLAAPTDSRRLMNNEEKERNMERSNRFIVLFKSLFQKLFDVMENGNVQEYPLLTLTDVCATLMHCTVCCGLNGNEVLHPGFRACLEDCARLLSIDPYRFGEVIAGFLQFWADLGAMSKDQIIFPNGDTMDTLNIFVAVLERIRSSSLIRLPFESIEQKENFRVYREDLRNAARVLTATVVGSETFLEGILACLEHHLDPKIPRQWNQVEATLHLFSTSARLIKDTVKISLEDDAETVQKKQLLDSKLTDLCIRILYTTPQILKEREFLEAPVLCIMQSTFSVFLPYLFEKDRFQNELQKQQILTLGFNVALIGLACPQEGGLSPDFVAKEDHASIVSLMKIFAMEESCKMIFTSLMQQGVEANSFTEAIKSLLLWNRSLSMKCRSVAPELLKMLCRMVPSMTQSVVQSLLEPMLGRLSNVTERVPVELSSPLNLEKIVEVDLLSSSTTKSLLLTLADRLKDRAWLNEANYDEIFLIITSTVKHFSSQEVDGKHPVVSFFLDNEHFLYDVMNSRSVVLLDFLKCMIDNLKWLNKESENQFIHNLADFVINGKHFTEAEKMELQSLLVLHVIPLIKMKACPAAMEATNSLYQFQFIQHIDSYKTQLKRMLSEISASEETFLVKRYAILLRYLSTLLLISKQATQQNWWDLETLYMDLSQLVFSFTGEKGELVEALCAWPSILYQSKKQGPTWTMRNRNFKEELARSIVMFIKFRRRWSQENLKQNQYYEHMIDGLLPMLLDDRDFAESVVQRAYVITGSIDISQKQWDAFLERFSGLWKLGADDELPSDKVIRRRFLFMFMIPCGITKLKHREPK